MSDYDDALNELRANGNEDIAEVFEKYKASELRKKAGRADQLEKELQAAKSELDSVKTAPAREKAFRDAGVNIDELRPAERQMIQDMAPDGSEDVSAWAQGIIEKYELPVTISDGDHEDPPAAAAVANAAKSAPVGGKIQGATLNPAVVAEWSAEKMAGFSQKYPEQWEALKRGESVAGVGV